MDMVEPLALTSKQNKALSQVVVELVGVAGTGKTTLTKALNQRDERIQISGDLKLRKLGHLSIFLTQLAFVLPLLLSRGPASRRFTWDEIKSLVYLQAWPSVLRRASAMQAQVILLDQGPIFKLATLHAFGPEKLKARDSELWWARMFEEWGSTLDLVIWLNAPADILVKRINTRQKKHTIKGKNDREARQFLAQYQASYEHTLNRLAAQGRMTVACIDTSQKEIDQVVEEVLQRINSCVEDTK
jgi:deoxyadenosine/deoxycytidine kinase